MNQPENLGPQDECSTLIGCDRGTGSKLIRSLEKSLDQRGAHGIAITILIYILRYRMATSARFLELFKPYQELSDRSLLGCWRKTSGP